MATAQTNWLLFFGDSVAQHGRRASKSLPDPDTPLQQCPTHQTQSKPFGFSTAHADDVTMQGYMVEAYWPWSQQAMLSRVKGFEIFQTLPKE